MKKLNRRLIKGTNWALSGLMALIGFSGCEKFGAVEYGVPHADYEFSGKVTNEQGEPIPDIQVKIHEKMENKFSHGLDSTRTDANGKYKMSFSNFPTKEYHLIATDKDGKENGSYLSDTTRVEITNDDFYKKGKDWYNGTARKEVDIILKTDEQAEE